jgi:CheY-like chemotaxis protein
VNAVSGVAVLTSCKSISLLYVEDEILVQYDVEHALKGAGYDPVLACNGEEALDLLERRSGEFSGLVTDVHLGGPATGWDVARRARQLLPSLIYVGRAADALFTRLRAHTTDRLGGRWDRFSWFGLREVGADGVLTSNPVPWSQAVVIETMEAVLIESMEPPLNRKRGDNFSGAEYLQASDPEVESARKRALLGEMMKAANLS